MGSQVRVVLEYQYDNAWDTAVEALKFIKNYFGNGDGYKHVANPHPVNYYIWGAGAASYFGASNPLGLVNDITVPGGNFEGVKLGSATLNKSNATASIGGSVGGTTCKATLTANFSAETVTYSVVIDTPFSKKKTYNGTVVTW